MFGMLGGRLGLVFLIDGIHRACNFPNTILIVIYTFRVTRSIGNAPVARHSGLLLNGMIWPACFNEHRSRNIVQIGSERMITSVPSPDVRRSGSAWILRETQELLLMWGV